MHHLFGFDRTALMVSRETLQVFALERRAVRVVAGEGVLKKTHKLLGLLVINVRGHCR